MHPDNEPESGDGQRGAWVQLAVFVVVIAGAVAVHQASRSEFRFLLAVVFVGFLIVACGATVWIIWRRRDTRDEGEL